MRYSEQTLVSVDLSLVPTFDASVSVFDRGFLFGDSVYEVIRTYGGRLFHYERHFHRLRRSANSLGFDLPFSQSDLEAHLGELVEKLGKDECYVRIVVTRGAYDVALNPPGEVKPTTVAIAAEMPTWPEEFFTKGITLVTVGIRRNPRGSLNPRIKSGNYLNNVLATMEAKRAGAVDAVMLNESGYVTESSTANIFVVEDGGLITPPEEAGILDGVSRFTVMELAFREGIRCDIKLFGPEALHGAEECFLTSTTREIMPVRRVDEFDIPSPGPVTSRLLELFRKFTRS